MSDETNTKEKKIVFVRTEYDKNYPSYIDALDVYKSLLGDLDEKDYKKIILRLVEEMSILIHFVSKEHPEYIKFITAVRNREIKNDDSLEFDLMNEDELFKDVEIVENKEQNKSEKEKIEVEYEW